MREPRWTADQIPDQRGRTAVITGANTGLGFQMATLLASHGASIVLACRDQQKAGDAANRIRGSVPGSEISTVALDQASLTSVRQAASEIRARFPRIDLLLNNAGILGAAERKVTVDGLEATFETNHVGVFALTGLLMEPILATPGSRIVTMSSLTHSWASMDFDDLESEKTYQRNTVYSRSKLANLLFAYELQRRLDAVGASTISVAAHPGQSRTEFTRGLAPVARFIYGPKMRWATGLMMQDSSIGVLGAVRAATDPSVKGGEYYGPSGPGQFTGYPVRVKSSPASHRKDDQVRLWTETEKLTGAGYPLPQR
jgi:NAD(P)-dependent dehydrogenase (short-subunit alcohol dehydrogenase family)